MNKIITGVIADSVPPKNCPPGQNPLADIVPGGHVLLADSVPHPQNLSPPPPPPTFLFMFISAARWHEIIIIYYYSLALECVHAAHFSLTRPLS